VFSCDWRVASTTRTFEGMQGTSPDRTLLCYGRKLRIPASGTLSSELNEVAVQAILFNLTPWAEPTRNPNVVREIIRIGHVSVNTSRGDKVLVMDYLYPLWYVRFGYDDPSYLESDEIVPEHLLHTPNARYHDLGRWRGRTQYATWIPFRLVRSFRRSFLGTVSNKELTLITAQDLTSLYLEGEIEETASVLASIEIETGGRNTIGSVGGFCDIVVAAYEGDDSIMSTPFVSWSWQDRLIYAKPIRVTKLGFYAGYGSAEEYGRPYTNAATLGYLQGRIAPDNHGIGPEQSGDYELYKFTQLESHLSKLDGLCLETWCNKEDPEAFSFLVKSTTTGETREIPLTSRDIASWSKGYIVSIFLRKNPFTDDFWDVNEINENLEFGFVGYDPDVRFYTLRAIGIGCSFGEPVSGQYQSEIPVYSPAVVPSSDTAKLYKPSFYKIHHAVHEPAVVAEIEIGTFRSMNRILDPNFELTGLGLVKLQEDETTSLDIWTLENATIFSRNQTEAYDGNFCAAIKCFGSITQRITITEDDYGQVWKFGAALGYTALNVRVVLCVLFEDWEPFYGYWGTSKKIEGYWYEAWTPSFTVPDVSSWADVSISIEDDGSPQEGLIYVDSVVLGTADQATIEWGSMAADRAFSTGILISVVGFTSGSWDVLKPGMTIVAEDNLGKKEVRLREVYPKDNLIKVAENDINWSSVSKIYVYAEHKYWTRYQRFINLKVEKTAQELHDARMQ